MTLRAILRRRGRVSYGSPAPQAAGRAADSGAAASVGGRHVVELDDHDDGYAGPAEVHHDGVALLVSVQLGGFFQPIDGRYHWYGRVDRHDLLDRLLGPKAVVTVRTPLGEAEAVMSDPDLWGRYRLQGVGVPPFPVPSEVDAAGPDDGPAGAEGSAASVRAA